MAGERLEDRRGDGADAELDRRAVVDERQDVRGDGAVDGVGHRQRHLRQRAVGPDDQVELVGADRAFAGDEGRGGIDLGDDDAGHADRVAGEAVVGGEAVASRGIRAGELDHEDVDREVPGREVAAEVGEVGRVDVSQPGLGQPGGPAEAAEGLDRDVVAVLGLEEVAERDGQEHPHPAERGALGDERLDQRQRLGAALAPENAVSGADVAREVGEAGLTRHGRCAARRAGPGRSRSAGTSGPCRCRGAAGPPCA